MQIYLFQVLCKLGRVVGTDLPGFVYIASKKRP